MRRWREPWDKGRPVETQELVHRAFFRPDSGATWPVPRVARPSAGEAARRVAPGETMETGHQSPKIMSAFWIILLFVGYIALVRFVLPRLGVPT